MLDAALADHAGGWPLPRAAHTAVDTRYVLAAGGLLAAEHPAAAVALLRRHLPVAPGRSALARALGIDVMAAAASAAAMWALVAAVDAAGRAGAALTLALSGVAGAVVFLAVERTVGRTGPMAVLAAGRDRRGGIDLG